MTEESPLELLSSICLSKLIVNVGLLEDANDMFPEERKPAAEEAICLVPLA